MSLPRIERPDLPAHMTWKELEQLPAEIAEQIELWEGRVVWVRRGPGEHQIFMRRLTHELERCARNDMAVDVERCWVANLETNVFLGNSGKSDFLTPDFLVHRCLGGAYRDVRAADTVLVGEVLSPSNIPSDIEAEKSRYAKAGVPWYWEVTLRADVSAIAFIRAYGLEIGYAQLPDGISPLHPAAYRIVGEWVNDGDERVSFTHPFPIDIPWTALAY